jgi:hypothetical protein
MMMWNGSQGSGEIGKNDDGTYKDPHLVFKMNGDKLYMRGSGEFSGTLSASTIIGSTIIGSAFKNDNETLYLSTTSKEFTINNKQENYVLRIGDNFGVDSNGGINASLGTIAGWNIGENKLYYNLNSFN